MHLGDLPDYQLKYIADLAQTSCLVAGDDPMQEPREPQYPVGQTPPPAGVCAPLPSLSPSLGALHPSTSLAAPSSTSALRNAFG